MKSATSKGLNEMINFKQMGCVGSLKEYVEPIYDEPNDAQNGETYMAMNVPTNNCREPIYENSYSRNHPHPQTRFKDILQVRTADYQLAVLS